MLRAMRLRERFDRRLERIRWPSCPHLGPAPAAARAAPSSAAGAPQQFRFASAPDREGPDERRATARRHPASENRRTRPQRQCESWSAAVFPTGAPRQQVSPFLRTPSGGSTLRWPLGSCAESSWIIREERMRKNYSCTTGLRSLEGLAGNLVAVCDGSFDFASVEDAPVLKHVLVVHRPKRRLDGVVKARPRLPDGHRVGSRSSGRHETPRSCSGVPRTDGTTSTRQWTYGDADA